MNKRSLVSVLTTAVVALSLLSGAPAAVADIRDTAAVPLADDAAISFPSGLSRLSGTDRYQTAIQVARKYPSGVQGVFVATGQNFPDALSAAAAAAFVGGPLLLTPTGSLPASVKSELTRLAPKTIYIAGGTGAVSAAVEKSLREVAPVQRLGGASRYDTGNALVQKIFPSASHAFIATGRTFPDALAATGAAGSAAAPVILVDGAASSLQAQTRALLDKLGVTSVTIVGGSGAVSQGIQNQLAGVYETKRIGGSSRYETAARVNDAFFPAGSARAAFLATGQNFPDALAGAALAGRVKSPVYVTSPACVPGVTQASLQRLGAASTVALGGTAVVSDAAGRNIACLTAPAPTITGSARVGATLTVVPGAWTPGTSFSYQWLANGAVIGGATTVSLTPWASLAGKQISVRVTGSKPAHLTTTVLSGKTAAVANPSQPAPGTPPSSVSPINGGRDCPAAAPIKGNRGDDEWIYHVRGGGSYAVTNPEECFATEAAAVRAGYRKARN